MIDILFNKEKFHELPELDLNTVNNLNLKSLVRELSINDRESQYVVNVLCKLQQSNNDIVARQMAIQDFLDNGGLLGTLKKALEDVDSIAGERQTIKRIALNSGTRIESDQRKKTRSTFGNIMNISNVLLRCIGIYIHLGGVLAQYEFQSEYLQRLQSFFVNFTKSYEFSQFEEHIRRLSDIEVGNSNISMSVELLKEIGKMTVSFHEINEEDKKKSKGIRSSLEQELLENLTGVATQNLCDYLHIVVAAMEKQLDYLRDQLRFYNFALGYVATLQRENLEFFYPEIAEDYEETSVLNMYSIYLLAKHVKDIVPNDVKANRVTVLLGGNNTGKTCYVIGVALMQIFGQAGLPLPSLEESKICPVSDILSQFAAGEKDLGRFEEEVRELETILGKIDNKTLVIFNETFQSTVYEEIAQPFKDILDAMVEAGAHALVVTHNEPFISLCKDSGDVKLLKMNEGHEIEEVIYPI